MALLRYLLDLWNGVTAVPTSPPCRIVEADGHWLTVEETSKDGTVEQTRVLNAAAIDWTHDA